MFKFSNRRLGTNSNVGTLAPVPISASTLPENTQNQHRNAKRNPSTPDESTKAAATQRQKNPRCNSAINPAKQRPVTNMGMFFLAKHDSRATDIFPKDLPTKICADFTCKGCKCIRENCPYSHPRNARKSTAETIAAIVRHFSSKKIGWLNEWHFMKLGDFPADVKALMGGKDGLSSSKKV
jgi:hypothetical protein